METACVHSKTLLRQLSMPQTWWKEQIPVANVCRRSAETRKSSTDINGFTLITPSPGVLSLGWRIQIGWYILTSHESSWERILDKLQSTRELTVRVVPVENGAGRENKDLVDYDVSLEFRTSSHKVRRYMNLKSWRKLKKKIQASKNTSARKKRASTYGKARQGSYRTKLLIYNDWEISVNLHLLI